MQKKKIKCIFTSALPLISQLDALTIKIEDTPEFLEYHLDLAQSDIGRVIGKGDFDRRKREGRKNRRGYTDKNIQRLVVEFR